MILPPPQKTFNFYDFFDHPNIKLPDHPYAVYFKQTNFCDYGIARLEIDESLLEHGILSFPKIEAAMPDGSIIIYGINFKRKFHLDFSYLTNEKTDKNITIYLVAYDSFKTVGPHREPPQRLESVCSFSSIKKPANSNIYHYELFPNCFLVASEVPYPVPAGFPIFKLSLKEGIFKKEEFIPPILHINKEIAFREYHRNIIQSLKAQISFLEEYLKTLDSSQVSLSFPARCRYLNASLKPYILSLERILSRSSSSA